MTHQRRPLAVRAFETAARLSNALLAWPNRIVPPPFRLMQIGSAFWQSRVLYVAATLDLATILGDRRLAVADLAREAEADPAALRRLLRMLTAMGVFEETAPDVFRNNRLSDPLRSDRAGSVRAVVMMHNAPEMSRPWFDHLEQGVRAGAVPFELAHGQDFYSFLDAHPEFDALFAEAMDQVEALAGDSFATAFDWTRFGRVVDVGGSRGAKSMAILKRHPHLQAVVVDRAQTIEQVRRYWGGRQGPECVSRMRFEVGDVFSSVPPAVDSRDVYLLSAVLHGFDDEDCARALRTVVAAASTAGATIVLLEMVMPDRGADLTATSFDMQMFMATKGRERTLAEWRRVCAQGGVDLVEVVGLPSFGKMLVLRPVADG
ncbi:MAG: methyltransferase [Solirubrobacterales bacterium]